MDFAFIANRIIELALETFTVGVGFILGIALFFALIIAFQLFLEACFKVKNFLNKKLKADVKRGDGWRMDKEQLIKTIQVEIENSKLTYGEVKSILNYLIVFYSDKANNLLNSASIQEVAKQNRFKG